jgi:glycosyltransferase involved in cell wall biosynthesis
MKKPLFSIITVTYNSKDVLEKTVESVKDQSCKDYEYIVIDGKSTDGTIDVIKNYENEIDYWVSEEDKGIYDAMNKGIKNSSGQLIFFLNAGDTFYDKEVLQDVKDFYLKNNKPECLYGGINYINPFKEVGYEEVIKEKITLTKIKKGKMIRHQSLFVNKSTFDKVGYFDLSYGLGGDYEFECRLFGDEIECIYFDRVVTNFYGGGAGGDLFNSYKTKGRIIREKFGKFYYIKYLLVRGLYVLAIIVLRKLGVLKGILTFRKWLKNVF